MKNWLLLFLCCGMISVAQAQRTNTLFGDFDITGAFGGPLVEIGSVAGVDGTNVGGGGALVGRNFFLGGYGISEPKLLTQSTYRSKDASTHQQ